MALAPSPELETPLRNTRSRQRRPRYYLLLLYALISLSLCLSELLEQRHHLSSLHYHFLSVRHMEIYRLPSTIPAVSSKISFSCLPG